MPKPYQPNDNLSKNARSEGFRARSVYKLQELDKKFRLFKEEQTILDIGAYPGSWLQYIHEKIGDKGRALGVDLKQIDFIAKNVKTIIGDISKSDELVNRIKSQGFDQFDLVVADMAPNTTGIKYHDQTESLELNKYLFMLAQSLLKKDGRLISKIFQSELIYPFVAELKTYFNKVEITTVSASRDRSTEMYIVAKGFKQS